MPYLSDMPRPVDRSFMVDGMIHRTDETMIYINIVGPHNYELEEALECIYVDDRREFELVSVKRERNYVGACVCMLELVKKEDTIK